MEATRIATNKHTTLLEFLLIGLVASVCLAPRGSSAAPASAGGQHSQHPQQQQQREREQRDQEQQQVAKSEGQQVAELGQLLLERLAEQQQQREAAGLKSQLLKKNQAGAEWQQKKQAKSALKKKWHKIVDQLIDEELEAGPGAPSAVGEPVQRFQEQQKRADETDRPESGASKTPAPLQLDNADANHLESFLARQPSAEHLRRVMEDKFDIHRLAQQAMFSGNTNGLNFKFGSQESF